MYTACVYCFLCGCKRVIYAGWGKSRFIVVSMQNEEFVLLLLFINYCIIFHRNNCKPTFAHPAQSKSLYGYRSLKVSSPESGGAKGTRTHR